MKLNLFLESERAITLGSYVFPNNSHGCSENSKLILQLWFGFTKKQDWTELYEASNLRIGINWSMKLVIGRVKTMKLHGEVHATLM